MPEFKVCAVDVTAVSQHAPAGSAGPPPATARTASTSPDPLEVSA
jgi:hypothetical protein